MSQEEHECIDCGTTRGVEPRWPGYGHKSFMRCASCGDARVAREEANGAKGTYPAPFTSQRPQRPKGTLKEREAAQALEELRSALPEGTTVTAVLRHRNRMGTSWIDFYVFSAGWSMGEPKVRRDWLTRRMAKALGVRFDEKRECICVPFMNMDQAFQLTYVLASRLFRGQDRAGYMLKSEWL